MSYYFPSPPTSPTERKRKRSITSSLSLSTNPQHQQKQVKLDSTLLERYLTTGGSPNIVDTQRDFSLLCWACYSKSESALELLLRQEDLDLTTTHGPARSTALHIAASVGFLNGIDAILLRQQQQQQQNSNNEINLDPIINALDKHGQTPLHSAILSNQSACVELLLKYGARMDIQDNQGQLPLHLSVFYRRMECTKCLLKYLPKNTKLLWIPNKVDQRNVMEECIVGGCANILNELMMKVNKQESITTTNIISKSKNNDNKDNNNNCNNKDNKINNNINKSNLIRLAVFWNRIECLELLLGAGFSSSHTQQDVGTQQQMTETDPIHNNDILYQAVQQRKLDIVQCLRRKGNMNPCVSNGHNPSLIYAASHGFLDMIPFLLTRDTSIDCIRQAILLSEPLGLSDAVLRIITRLKQCPNGIY
ncbi:hypothetical protein INT45_000842 [Circinella minor]|uniref:Uncharacterized protein n=1 Tax=Circinella minor TaxID=1195481 RepID=A0A8H7VLP6_9FUNG|nr:hypothetical protein INT45_000842 [Circinella minor]